jgi:hypothetical protein
MGEIINDSEWALVSYTELDGIATMGDSFIKSLFNIMEEEQLVDSVFHEGNVNNQEDFLNMMKFGKNSLYVIIDKKAGNIPKRDQIGGIVWLNCFQMRSAYFHFCFFSNIRGEVAETVGEHAVLYLLNMKNMDNDYIFDVLIGTVPETNILARRWCNRMNFGKGGIIPNGKYIASLGKSVSCHIYYAERGEYRGRQ